MTDEEFSKIINARVEKLLDLYPIEDLKPGQATEEMKAGIARAYSVKGYRAYLENAVKIAIKNLAVTTSLVEQAYYKSRVDVLEQLLAKGQQMYNTVNPSKKGVR